MSKYEEEDVFFFSERWFAEHCNDTARRPNWWDQATASVVLAISGTLESGIVVNEVHAILATRRGWSFASSCRRGFVRPSSSFSQCLFGPEFELVLVREIETGT